MKKGLITLFVIAISAYAHAEDKSTGCGLGWKVNGSMSFIGTTTRNTTNSYTMPFGITSGTSGCSKHSIVMKEKELIHYAEANFENLAIEIAQGHGEALEGLTRILGCSQTGSASFTHKAQSQFQNIYSKGSTPGTMVRGIVHIIEKDQGLSNNCRPDIG